MMMNNLSHEDLVSELIVVTIQDMLYPKNKNYLKKRIACERELIHRLGGNLEEYCRINGMDTKELEKMI